MKSNIQYAAQVVDRTKELKMVLVESLLITNRGTFWKLLRRQVVQGLKDADRFNRMRTGLMHYRYQS